MALKDINWTELGEPQIAKLLPAIVSDSTEVITDDPDRFPSVNDAQKFNLSVLEEYLCPWKAFEPYYHDGNDLLPLVKREAAYLIVPYLIEMLRYDTTRNKSRIMSILSHLASYSNLENELVEDHLPEALVSEYRFYAARLFNTVFSGLDVYESLRNDRDRFIRAEAESLVDILNDRYEAQ